MFKIHKKFEKTTHYITDLKLCQVRLQDNSKFPWIMLIPKRKGASSDFRSQVKKIKFSC